MNELLMDWLQPSMMVFNNENLGVDLGAWRVAKEPPQTFIAYTWGPFANHRDALLRRCNARGPYDRIMQALRGKFEMGSQIFPGRRFPGGLLARLPS